MAVWESGWNRTILDDSCIPCLAVRTLGASAAAVPDADLAGGLKLPLTLRIRSFGCLNLLLELCHHVAADDCIVQSFAKLVTPNDETPILVGLSL